MDEVNEKRENSSSSKSDQVQSKKLSIEQEIQEFNKAAAKQKRVDEKKSKENDKKTFNDHQSRVSEQELKQELEKRVELVEKKRVLTRDHIFEASTAQN